MKYLLLASLLALPIQEADEAIVISPVERRAIVDQMERMQGTIDDLRKDLEKQKVRSNCA